MKTTDDVISAGQRLLLAVERRTRKIAALTAENAADLEQLHMLATAAVAQHGPGAGASPGVVASIVAPKNPQPE